MSKLYIAIGIVIVAIVAIFVIFWPHSGTVPQPVATSTTEGSVATTTTITTTTTGGGSGVTTGGGAGSIAAEFFGMDVNSPNATWPLSTPAGPIPARSLRIWDSGANWAQIEGSRGNYNWSILDGWVNKAQGQGMQVMYTFGHTPDWATSGANSGPAMCAGTNTGKLGCLPPSDLNADGTGTDAIWQEFVTALVGRYKGKIQYYELWNEQNAPNFWNGTEAQAVRMAKDAYSIIKTNDSQAGVVAPSIIAAMPNSLDQFLKAGGGQYVDVINFHGRSAGDLNNQAESVLTLVKAMQSIMAQDGVSAKPLWDTEGGWLPNKNQATTPDEQIAYIARQYLLLAGQGVGRYFWYNWDHTLWLPQGGVQPAATSYVQVANWMIGAAPAGPCEVQSNGTTYVCHLTRPNGYSAVAAWDTKGTATYAALPTYTQYRDLTGAITKVTASGAATNAISIGLKPILLETKTP